jgi:hypothetical protein
MEKMKEHKGQIIEIMIKNKITKRAGEEDNKSNDFKLIYEGKDNEKSGE